MDQCLIPCKFNNYEMIKLGKTSMKQHKLLAMSSYLKLKTCLIIGHPVVSHHKVCTHFQETTNQMYFRFNEKGLLTKIRHTSLSTNRLIPIDMRVACEKNARELSRFKKIQGKWFYLQEMSSNFGRQMH